MAVINQKNYTLLNSLNEQQSHFHIFRQLFYQNQIQSILKS
jgi:hypothetical protein